MLRVYFGSPGAGKTTLAVKMALKERRRKKHAYKHVYLNFFHQVPGCAYCNVSGLGTWTFPDSSYLLLDEAGIEYNSRKHKTFPQEAIEWYKLHRHYMCDVELFSQSWEDMDITLRRLCTELWYMFKIGPFTICRRVFKRVTVDKNTEQIIDGYRMAHVLTMLLPFLHNWKITFRPFYYRYFDSWTHPHLIERSFDESLVPYKTRKQEIMDDLKRVGVVVLSRLKEWRFLRSRKNTTPGLDNTETPP